MIHLGMIGLGTIFQKQKLVLEKMPEQYRLEAVCDTDEGKLNGWTECACYSDVDLFLENEQVEVVLISTPPQTHVLLAEKCLSAGKHVLLEKPAAVSMEELEKMYELAEQQKKMLYVAYHAAFATDLLWYLEQREALEKTYSMGKMKHISCRFFDPYMKDGEIMPEKLSICGSFLDSGVNELSVCEKLIDLDGAKRTYHREARIHWEDFRTTYESYSTYRTETYSFSLETGFDRGINHKETVLTFEEDGRELLLEHSQQRVVLKDPEKGEQQLWKAENKDRLEAQYEGVFREFYTAWKENRGNKKETMKIHRLLLSDGSVEEKSVY